MVEDKWVQDVVEIAQTSAYIITRNYKGFAEADDVQIYPNKNTESESNA